MHIDCVGHGQGSRASRSPLKAQRAPGGKKLRYVGRVCPAGVAQHPPRRTYWLTMNFPLYSPTAPGAARKPGEGEEALAVHSQVSPKRPLEERAGRGWGAPVDRTSSRRKLSPSPWSSAMVSHSDS